MNDDRLMKIETKLAFQEKTIRELNDVVFEQQQEIDKLKLICETLFKQNKALAEMSMGSDGPANEKPPHY